MQYNPVLESQKVNDSQGHDGEDDDYYDGDHNDDGNSLPPKLIKTPRL